MAGSLRQRGADSWQLRVHVGRDGATKKKVYVSQTFRGTKRQAERALAALVSAEQAQSPKANRESTLEMLLAEWLEHAARSFSPRTVDVTKTYIDSAIAPALGSMRLTARDIERFYGRVGCAGEAVELYGPRPGAVTPAPFVDHASAPAFLSFASTTCVITSRPNF